MGKAIKHPEWKTTLKERISYAIGFNGAVGESLILQGYLTTYLLMTGIDVGITAVILFIIKGIDAVDDLLFGWLVDRIHPEKNEKLRKLVGNGRYIPWLRLFFGVMPVAVILLYHIPVSAPTWLKITWFCVTYLAADLGYTLLDVPMNSLLTTMTEDSHERDHIIMTRSLFQMGILGAVYFGFTILISEQVGMSISTTAAIFSACMLLCMLPMIFNVKEHTMMVSESEKNENKTGISFLEAVKCLLANRNLLSYYGGSILAGCFATASAANMFASYYLFGSSLFSMLLTIPSLFLMLAMNVFIPKLAMKYDKNRIRMVALAFGLATSAMVYFVGYQNIPIYLLVMGINLIPSCVAGAVGAYLIPNCIEYGKYKTSKDATGISFAFGTFAAKFPSAIASSLGLWILGAYGWQSIHAESFAEIATLNITQSKQALHGLWVITAGVPIIGNILAFICYLFYNLNDKDAAIMAKANCGEITRDEAEKLLSKKYARNK